MSTVTNVPDLLNADEWRQYARDNNINTEGLDLGAIPTGLTLLCAPALVKIITFQCRRWKTQQLQGIDFIPES